MTIVANLHRRTAILLIAITAAAAAFVPLAAQSSYQAHIDPALLGLHGRVKVILQSNDATAAETAVRGAGGTVTRDLPIAHGFAATVSSDAVASLAKQTAVRTISLDAKVHVLGAPDSSKNRSVYPQAVNADKMWNSGYSGSGVTVAVIDTGIANVPDLAGKV